MKIELGIKSDPIEYRYSFRWLFGLMARHQVRHLQLGSFFELYSLPDRYFANLRALASDHGVTISSCFTAHRELGGFFSADPDLQKVAYEAYERYIEVAALLGARSVGSNPGSVQRDQLGEKAAGTERYMAAVEMLREHARSVGLAALTVEPMSCLAEPPSTPDEIASMMERFAASRAADPARSVPVYLCADVSHGLADSDGMIVYTHDQLLEAGVPWTWELHLKNTDARYSSTFGFGYEGCERGVIDLAEVRRLIEANGEHFPRDEIIAYIEIGGPKLGRDYADPLLEVQLSASIQEARALLLADESVKINQF